jgi:hypothetical protein
MHLYMCLYIRVCASVRCGLTHTYLIVCMQIVQDANFVLTTYLYTNIYVYIYGTIADEKVSAGNYNLLHSLHFCVRLRLIPD